MRNKRAAAIHLHNCPDFEELAKVRLIHVELLLPIRKEKKAFPISSNPDWLAAESSKSGQTDETDGEENPVWC